MKVTKKTLSYRERLQRQKLKVQIKERKRSDKKLNQIAKQFEDSIREKETIVQKFIRKSDNSFRSISKNVKEFFDKSENELKKNTDENVKNFEKQLKNIEKGYSEKIQKLENSVAKEKRKLRQEKHELNETREFYLDQTQSNIEFLNDLKSMLDGSNNDLENVLRKVSKMVALNNHLSSVVGIIIKNEKKALKNDKSLDKENMKKYMKDNKDKNTLYLDMVKEARNISNIQQ